MTHSEFSQFSRRHIGPCASELDALLQAVGSKSLDSLMDETVPEDIRLKRPMALPPALTETQALSALEEIMGENQVLQSLIGTGYYGTVLPPVIQRNVLENPGWYTAYTPYQAEISQGRMEALLNFQTMVCDLTGMEISNASLLDEATAAAEAMAMCHDLKGGNRFFVADDCHPQTLALLQTRAEPLGLELTVGDPDNADFTGCVGVIIQYPSTCGRIRPIQPLIAKAQAAGAMAIVATDLLALTLITPPGEVGADIVVGSAQRFGVPFGYGGPHAAFLATKDTFKRRMPGRLIGVSKDAEGNHALRLTLQTREQHIRREKATSNICTAQVLLAVIASLYAVYHGPEGLRAIAESIHEKALDLANRLLASGYEISTEPFFDTLAIKTGEKTEELLNKARRAGYNLRPLDAQWLGLSLDETVESIDPIAAIFDAQKGSASLPSTLLAPFARKSAYLAHPVFNTHHTESELMRYIKRLETKDLSLTTSMIPLGSCTMKLNAAAEMFPVTWKKVGGIHPLAPVDQAKGYGKLFANLENWLGEITGLPAVSLQPNAGSQGEYAGLLVIRAYHHNRGEAHRNICLIPVSAHGTNPASAVMAGFEVVGVACDELGNVNLQDLETKAETHKDRLGALMVTYPSTHGVFEETIARICEIIHLRGGQVYLDGANMNAQVGICRPGDFGADVCHLNLHKTFCIPHGGGGPGVGPICAAPHLAPYLPGHNLIATGGSSAIGPVSQAPWGSASILVIPWMYIAMMGPEGLTEATKVAILNANYIAQRLAPYYKVLYTGKNGRVAHECIIDIREWKARAGIEVEDVAKRLMDFGFHAPTMSWPVPGTLMIEPTESESKAELDRFCEAMILIHAELTAIESGALDKANNPLKNAPHTAKAVISDQWDRPYSREQAAYPADWLREHKFWPSVARVDNVYGDRNIFCTCVPMEA